MQGEKSMINNLSEIILRYLIKASVIDDTEEYREYYVYGIEITLSSILNIIIILAIGLVSRNLIESIVFLICFIPIRQFTGGFHAKTYFRCNLLFGICFTTLIIIYKLTYQYINIYWGITMVLFSSLIFFSECPVENVNKPIPNRKRIVHKVISVFLSVVYGIIGVKHVSKGIGVILLYTLILISVLVIIATFQDIERRWKFEKGE